MLKKHYLSIIPLTLIILSSQIQSQQENQIECRKNSDVSYNYNNSQVGEKNNSKNYSHTAFKVLERDYNNLHAWGLHTTIDLKECDPELIRSEEAIKEYVMTLCDMIDVHRVDEPLIKNFGREEHVKGYTLVQLIETSLVSGHFANLTNSAYIDIFSCKIYNPYTAIAFTKTFFQAKQYSVNILLRF